MLHTEDEKRDHKCPMDKYPKYESAMWGHGNYVFSEDSVIDLHPTAILYENIKFRPGIKLSMKENTFIGDGVKILVPMLIMMKGSQINAGTVISGRKAVMLSKNAVVGYNCVISSSSDTPRGKYMNDASPEDKRVIKQGPILLRENCFVSSLSFIGPDVTIGERTVVGLHTSVVHSLPSDTIYAVDKNVNISKNRTEWQNEQ